MKRGCGCGMVLAALGFLIVLYLFFQPGLYTVQPIGALPDGVTLLVWRAPGEPVFNSPDATCLRTIGSVSLLCRALALAQAPVDRIVLRLPYMDWAYLLSTGGRQYEQ